MEFFDTDFGICVKITYSSTLEWAGYNVKIMNFEENFFLVSISTVQRRQSVSAACCASALLLEEGLRSRPCESEPLLLNRLRKELSKPDKGVRMPAFEPWSSASETKFRTPLVHSARIDKVHRSHRCIGAIGA
jgi:hypothetical protein